MNVDLWDCLAVFCDKIFQKNGLHKEYTILLSPLPITTAGPKKHYCNEMRWAAEVSNNKPRKKQGRYQVQYLTDRQIARSNMLFEVMGTDILPKVGNIFQNETHWKRRKLRFGFLCNVRRDLDHQYHNFCASLWHTHEQQHCMTRKKNKFHIGFQQSSATSLGYGRMFHVPCMLQANSQIFRLQAHSLNFPLCCFYSQLTQNQSPSSLGCPTFVTSPSLKFWL